MSDINLEVPEFDAITAAFGADLKDYPAEANIPEEHWKRDRYHEVASKLFFNGGRLSDHGLKLKSGIDGRKAMNAIRAWLCSFAPKHEHKMATVSYALSQWCEDCERTDPVVKAQPAPKKRRKRK